MKLRDRIEAVKEIPLQVQMTAKLAITSIALSIVAMMLTLAVLIGGRRNAS